MARFDGIIGFISTEETEPGVYKEVVREYHRRGTILKHAWNTNAGSDGTNDNYTLSNRVTVVATKEMITNCAFARYINVRGVLWEISNVEIDTERPELIFTLGGLYNG